MRQINGVIDMILMIQKDRVTFGTSTGAHGSVRGCARDPSDKRTVDKSRSVRPPVEGR